jgi:hypothetical protein
MLCVGEEYVELEPASALELSRLLYVCDLPFPLSAVCKASVTFILRGVDSDEFPNHYPGNLSHERPDGQLSLGDLDRAP